MSTPTTFRSHMGIDRHPTNAAAINLGAHNKQRHMEFKMAQSEQAAYAIGLHGRLVAARDSGDAALVDVLIDGEARELHARFGDAVPAVKNVR